MRYLFIIGCLLLAACSGHSPAPASQAVAPSDGNEAYTAAPAFTGENLRLIGRFDLREPGAARFSWSGSAVDMRFMGTGVRLALQSSERLRFLVEVDGSAHDLWVEPGSAYYTLAENLVPGEHQLRLTRVTEAFTHVTALVSQPQIIGKGGKLLTPVAAPARRLLVLGDSITAGYGVEGESQSCSYAHGSSSQQLTYAALAAKQLKADLHSIAWSGIGVWRSYAEETPKNPTMLVRYTRTLADDASSQWNPAQYQPQAILINLGTNDYWQGSVTSAYRNAIAQLIGELKTSYNNTPIYLIVSPMLSGDARTDQARVFASLSGKGVTTLDIGHIESSDGLGCDYHPNLITQTRLGKVLAERLAKDLHWQ